MRIVQSLSFQFLDVVQEEADLAAALFQMLRGELLEAVKKQQLKRPVVVGVITPYREQVTCIQETLKYVLGPELSREVTFLHSALLHVSSWKPYWVSQEQSCPHGIIESNLNVGN